VAGEVYGLTELPGILAEGLHDGESVVVVDVEAEMAGFPIKRRIACDSEAFGVVEDDDWIPVCDAGVEPGKAATRKNDFSWSDGLE
jgi:hypothetical protein